MKWESGKPYCEGRQFRPLAILKIQNIGNQNGVGGNGKFLFTLFGGLRLERFPKGGGGHHPGCQHDQVNTLRDHGRAGEHIVGHDDQTAGAVILDGP